MVRGQKAEVGGCFPRHDDEGGTRIDHERERRAVHDRIDVEVTVFRGRDHQLAAVGRSATARPIARAAVCRRQLRRLRSGQLDVDVELV